MVSEDEVREIVCKVINEIDTSILKQGNPHKIDEILLMGQMDSLAMVTLIIHLEEELKQKFGKNIALLGREKESVKGNPFKTVGTVVEYVAQIL